MLSLANCTGSGVEAQIKKKKNRDALHNVLILQLSLINTYTYNIYCYLHRGRWKQTLSTLTLSVTDLLEFHLCLKSFTWGVGLHVEKHFFLVRNVEKLKIHFIFICGSWSFYNVMWHHCSKHSDSSRCAGKKNLFQLLASTFRPVTQETLEVTIDQVLCHLYKSLYQQVVMVILLMWKAPNATKLSQQSSLMTKTVYK